MPGGMHPAPRLPAGIRKDAKEVAQLRVKEGELAELIVGHRFWCELSPADVPDALHPVPPRPVTTREGKTATG